MRMLPALVMLLTGCAPVYYGSIVYDLETTLACSICREKNPLVPKTHNRAFLYSYATSLAAAYTVVAEKSRYRTVLYIVPTILHLFFGTRNLRYVRY